MPVLGYYTVTFAYKAEREVRLDVNIAVGDGDHPVVDRAREYMARVGFDPDLWEVFCTRDADPAPDNHRQYRV